MSSYVYNQSHNKQSDINQVTIGAMGDHCFGRGGAGGFRVFSLSLRGACRISHLVVPKQQNGSQNQQMVTPFQQNGYPRKYKMGCANYMSTWTPVPPQGGDAKYDPDKIRFLTIIESYFRRKNMFSTHL